MACTADNPGPEPYDTRFVPAGVEIPQAVDVEVASLKTDWFKDGCPQVIVAQDYAPFIMRENRIVNTLLAEPFNLTMGDDLVVVPIFALGQGVPDCVSLVSIGSNSFGLLSSGLAERSVAVQSALDAFVQRGGTLAVHLADQSLDAYSYLAPGANGTRVAGNFGRQLFLEVPESHPLRHGPDELPGTGDEQGDDDFAPILPFSGACCVTHGNIATMLPTDATIVMRDESGQPVYGEYYYGENFGRVILTTITAEWGFAGYFGQSQALIQAHLSHLLVDRTDGDGDGTLLRNDCDDHNPAIGERLFATDFQSEPNPADRLFFETDQLNTPWEYDEGSLVAPDGGQQAVLHHANNWDNIVVSATVSLDGTRHNCYDCDGGPGDTNRYRIGVTLRSNLASSQDEGYAGYRCALAENASGEGGHPYFGHSTGSFLQLAAFDMSTEDGLDSECFGGPNVSFQEFDRANQSIVDLQGGDTATINFYAVGNQLICETVNSVGHTVRTVAETDLFATGTVGLSTLNAFGRFHSVQACAANGLPIR
jgi:hypothetical protein